MYTQCPECQIAFRVTAKVLQQAAGNVRCGSCGHAFSALEYLSEEMPEQVAPAEESAADTEQSVDDLAETSKRLLQTLDELAGPDDVRIEDTGVEWRVLDDAAAADVRLSPDEVPAEEEIRYDDNTPLPDDFGDDDEGRTVAPLPVPQRRTEDYVSSSDELEERQGDLALSEPDEWTDILEEVSDPSAEALEVEEELAAIHTELSAIDEALTDEVPQLDEEEIDVGSEDEPDEVEADLIEQIEAGAAAELAEADDDDRDEDIDDYFADESDEDSAAEFAADEKDETGSFEAMGVEIEAEGDEDADAEGADELASLEADAASVLQEQLDELELAMAGDADAEPDDFDDAVIDVEDAEAVAADDSVEDESDEESEDIDFSELD